MDALEPASLDEVDDSRLRVYGARLAPLPPLSREALAPIPHYQPLDVRDATLLERLSALNPARRGEP